MLKDPKKVIVIVFFGLIICLLLIMNGVMGLFQPYEIGMKSKAFRRHDRVPVQQIPAQVVATSSATTTIETAATSTK